MSPSLENRVENSLRSTKYHPEFADEAHDKLQELLEKFNDAGSPESMKDEIYAIAYDATLMKEKYFSGRLQFLTKLVEFLGNRDGSHLQVAEDGCGTGVDLHVLQDLLGETVKLTGIDCNQASLQKARERVPSAEYLSDFSENTFDVIYADYVSIDRNMIWEIAGRGEKNFNALNSPGVILHNADMNPIHMYSRLFGGKFSRIIPPAFLAEVPEGPDCYLCRFEKD